MEQDWENTLETRIDNPGFVICAKRYTEPVNLNANKIACTESI
jgi:hypothetical protein